MPLTQEDRFVTLSIGCWVGAVFFMTLLNVFSLELLYICSFAGTITAFVTLDAPTFRPAWYRRVKLVVFIGAVGMIGTTVFRILQFL